MEGRRIPEVTFKCREGDNQQLADGGCGFIGGEWKDVTTRDIFKDKRVVVFSLPGAFTPTCSSQQVPGYEKHYDEIKANGVDEVYCVSVNDAFVMNAWARDQGIEKVKMIPDGNAEFTEGVGFSTTFKNRGFGQRSWRYSAVIIDGIIEKEFVEPGLVEDSDPDPFEVSDAETMLAYLKENK
jgi:peroxiredoxin|tara:strand:+ start:885 stop:1430 length:546 start_codon:yes stop_codon:yes gene_type:complete